MTYKNGIPRKRYSCDLAVIVNDDYYNDIVGESLKVLGETYNLKIYGNFVVSVYYQGAISNKHIPDIIRSAKVVLFLDETSEAFDDCIKVRIPAIKFDRFKNEVFLFSNPINLMAKCIYLLEHNNELEEEFENANRNS